MNDAIAEANKQIGRLEREQENLSSLLKENQEFINQSGDKDSDILEQQHPELLDIPLEQLESKCTDFQSFINKSLDNRKEKKINNSQKSGRWPMP